MARNAALDFRSPATTWMITAAFFALCLHGACWFLVSVLTGEAQALTATQRQMLIALAWMVGALAMWRISPPSSRLHAIVTLLVCSLFVTSLGSVGALTINLLHGAEPSKNLLSSFTIFGGLMILGQLALAVPSGLLLQGLALTRASTGAQNSQPQDPLPQDPQP